MACDGRWSSHPWEWRDGRLVCPDCGLADATTARLRRDVIDAAVEAGLIPPPDPAG